jgi:polyisoprenoid-binding protein YceI
MTISAPEAASAAHNSTLPAPGRYVIDPTHSAISLTIRHLVAAKVRGRFTDFSGEINVTDNQLASTTEVTINVASIDTGVGDRDDHLRSGDFLDVEQYPTATFKSAAIRPNSSGGFTLDGTLTIRDITKPVTLDLVFGGEVLDPWGGVRTVFNASTEINREEFGLTWNQALETGGVMIGKTAKIEIDIEAVKQDDAG